MTQAEAPVLIEVRNRVGYLTLNRPAGLNAVTLEMVLPQDVALALRFHRLGQPCLQAKCLW